MVNPAVDEFKASSHNQQDIILCTGHMFFFSLCNLMKMKETQINSVGLSGGSLGTIVIYTHLLTVAPRFKSPHIQTDGPTDDSGGNFCSSRATKLTGFKIQTWHNGTVIALEMNGIISCRYSTRAAENGYLQDSYSPCY